MKNNNNMLNSILHPVTNAKSIEVTLQKNKRQYFRYDEYLKDKVFSYIYFADAGMVLLYPEFSIAGSIPNMQGCQFTKNTWVTLVNKKGEVIADRMCVYQFLLYTQKSYSSSLLLNETLDLQKCFVEYTGADTGNGRRFSIQLFWNEKSQRTPKPFQSLELIKCSIRANRTKNYFPYSDMLKNRTVRQIFINNTQFPLETNANPQYENFVQTYITLVLVDNTGREVVHLPIYNFCITSPGFIHQFNGVIIDWEKSYIEFENVADVANFVAKGIELNVSFEEIQ